MENTYKTRLRQNVMLAYMFVWGWVGVLSMFCNMQSYAKEYNNENNIQTSPGNLYAKSAVLMDGSSGRVLYEKNGKEFMSNASTTKILTCILAMENAKLTEVVTVSAYASTMPDVQLHIKEGERYYLKDLLYSLMLESHNDVAVAIAEHVSGSQEEFSKLMNDKAREIGCKNTVFLTPNGLDATQEIEKDGVGRQVSHGTTAEDLARIMRYCIKISPQKEEFIRVTCTSTYTFQDIDKTRNFTCRNHNAFFNMMEGVISGKTGFTAKAGYCYVGALEKNGKCYIVALLACGWPGNKNYKWADCKKLMEYGLQEYYLFDLKKLEESYGKELEAEVRNAKRQKISRPRIICLKRREWDIQEVLLKRGEELNVKISKNLLEAPLYPGEIVGRIEYYIQQEKWMTEQIYCDKKVEKVDFWWCITKIIEKVT